MSTATYPTPLKAFVVSQEYQYTVRYRNEGVIFATSLEEANALAEDITVSVDFKWDTNQEEVVDDNGGYTEPVEVREVDPTDQKYSALDFNDPKYSALIAERLTLLQPDFAVGRERMTVDGLIAAIERGFRAGMDARTGPHALSVYNETLEPTEEVRSALLKYMVDHAAEKLTNSKAALIYNHLFGEDKVE
jgi:hypothetical protein